MKITDKEKEWIESRLIFDVENSQKRSDIQVAARSLSFESEDPENSYWLLVNHFIDAKNDDDLKKALKQVNGLNLLEATTDYGLKKPKRSGGKRTRK